MLLSSHTRLPSRSPLSGLPLPAFSAATSMRSSTRCQTHSCPLKIPHYFLLAKSLSDLTLSPFGLSLFYYQSERKTDQQLDQLPDWAEKFLVERVHHLHGFHLKSLATDMFNQLRLAYPPGADVEVLSKQGTARKWSVVSAIDTAISAHRAGSVGPEELNGQSFLFECCRVPAVVVRPARPASAPSSMCATREPFVPASCGFNRWFPFFVFSCLCVFYSRSHTRVEREWRTCGHEQQRGVSQG